MNAIGTDRAFGTLVMIKTIFHLFRGIFQAPMQIRFNGCRCMGYPPVKENPQNKNRILAGVHSVSYFPNGLGVAYLLFRCFCFPTDIELYDSGGLTPSIHSVVLLSLPALHGIKNESSLDC